MLRAVEASGTGQPTTLTPIGRPRRPGLGRARPAADLDRGRPRLPAAARHPHAPGLLRRPDLRRQQGPGRLEGDRLPRTGLDEGGPHRPLHHAAIFRRRRGREGQGVPRWPLRSKPAKTDVVIIGAGASGAAAAKVLCEAGVKVVALEKGPWRTKESSAATNSPTSTATICGPTRSSTRAPGARPRPMPRAARTSAPCRRWSAAARSTGRAGCPASPTNDFRMRTVAGDLPGASLADWPITYDELEPYYLKVEWAFGVSGEAGRQPVRRSRRSGGYPCPPMPLLALRRRNSCRAATALGWNAFPTPQAALSRPFNGRKATVVSAFAQQHGDPTGTRSSALNVFVPDAVATGKLRPAARVLRARTRARRRRAASRRRSTRTRTATRSSRRRTSSSSPAARWRRRG